MASTAAQDNPIKISPSIEEATPHEQDVKDISPTVQKATMDIGDASAPAHTPDALPPISRAANNPELPHITQAPTAHTQSATAPPLTPEVIPHISHHLDPSILQTALSRLALPHSSLSPFLCDDEEEQQHEDDESEDYRESYHDSSSGSSEYDGYEDRIEEPELEGGQGNLSQSAEQDARLKDLFRLTFAKEAHVRIKKKEVLAKKKSADVKPSAEDIARHHLNRTAPSVLVFAKTGGDVSLSSPSRPILSLSAASSSSSFLQRQLKSNPELRRIEYDHNVIDTSTITRWIACLSPCLRADGLPSYDIVETARNGGKEVQALRIQWSMDELVDLYRFAVYMGSPDVCDMVVSQLYADLHRAVPRAVIDEDGITGWFDGCAVPVEWVRELMRLGNAKAIDLLSDILIAKRELGWAALERVGLENWDAEFKDVFVRKLEMLDLDKGEEFEMEKLSDEKVCQRFHQHYESYGPCYRDTPLPTAIPAPESEINAMHWRHQAELHVDFIAAKYRVAEMEAEEEVFNGYKNMQRAWKAATTQAEKVALVEDMRAYEGAAGLRELNRREDDAERAKLAEMREMENEELQDLEDAMPTMLIYPPFLPSPPHPTSSNEKEDTHGPKSLVSNFFPAHLGNGPDLNPLKQDEKIRLVGEKYQLFEEYYGEVKAQRLAIDGLNDRETREWIKLSQQVKVVQKDEKEKRKKGMRAKPQGRRTMKTKTKAKAKSPGKGKGKANVGVKAGTKKKAPTGRKKKVQVENVGGG